MNGDTSQIDCGVVNFLYNTLSLYTTKKADFSFVFLLKCFYLHKSSKPTTTPKFLLNLKVFQLKSNESTATGVSYESSVNPQ